MTNFIPNSTQVPNDFFDRYMALLTPEEFKVLMYIARYTNSLMLVNGSRIASGAGISVNAVQKALAYLKACRMVDEIVLSVPALDAEPRYRIQPNSELVDIAFLEQRRQNRGSSHDK